MTGAKVTPDWQVKFDRFWLKWPPRITPTGRCVKLNKVAAEIWFRVNKPDDALFDEIMAGVEAYAKAQDPHYIQDAFRWLQRKRWQDQYDLPKVKKHETTHLCHLCHTYRVESEMVQSPQAGFPFAWVCKGSCR